MSSGGHVIPRSWYCVLCKCAVDMTQLRVPDIHRLQLQGKRQLVIS